MFISACFCLTRDVHKMTEMRRGIYFRRCATQVSKFDPFFGASNGVWQHSTACASSRLRTRRQPPGGSKEGSRQIRVLVREPNAHARKIGTLGHCMCRRSFRHFVTDQNRSTEFLNHACQPGSFPNQPPKWGTVVFAPDGRIRLHFTV